jgi:hypothetical protein
LPQDPEDRDRVLREIVANGQRRVRRRRITMGVGAAGAGLALVAVVALAVRAPSHPQQLSTADASTTSTTAPTTTTTPTSTTDGTTSTSATTTTTPVGTDVEYLSPVNADGLRAGFNLVQTLDGDCSGGSEAAQTTAYRCFTGDLVIDPCWPDPATSPDTVVCLTKPWSRDVTRINTASLPPPEAPAPTDLDFPWGVELTTGEHCLISQGAHSTFNGRPIDYECDNSDLVLLRTPDRNEPLWTFDTAHNGPTPTPGPTVTVRTAWFGSR